VCSKVYTWFVIYWSTVRVMHNHPWVKLCKVEVCVSRSCDPSHNPLLSMSLMGRWDFIIHDDNDDENIYIYNPLYRHFESIMLSTFWNVAHTSTHYYLYLFVYLTIVDNTVKGWVWPDLITKGRLSWPGAEVGHLTILYGVCCVHQDDMNGCFCLPLLVQPDGECIHCCLEFDWLKYLNLKSCFSLESSTSFVIKTRGCIFQIEVFLQICKGQSFIM